MATAARAMAVKLNKSQKKKLRTGPIKDIVKYVRTFANKFCRQYGILHWQEDLEGELLMIWSKAQNDHPEEMQIPAYSKSVLYHHAAWWEKKYRKENHMEEIVPANEPIGFIPEVSEIDLSDLTDVECLILELHYGLGRSGGDRMSIKQIAGVLHRGETFVKVRHNKALEILRAKHRK